MPLIAIDALTFGNTRLSPHSETTCINFRPGHTVARVLFEPDQLRSRMMPARYLKGIEMRKVLILAALGVALAGCNAASRTDRTIAGAGIGAATGAAIGGLATGSWGGALAGAAIGGVGGGVIGNATTPQNCWTRDQYGRRIRVSCP